MGSREQTCGFLADQWVGLLETMTKQLEDAGIAPILQPSSLRDAIVITLDEVLPEHLELKPRHVALAGSSAIVTQRWLKRKEIAAHYERTQGAAERADVVASLDPLPGAEAAAPPPPAQTQPEDTSGQVAPATAVHVADAIKEAIVAARQEQVDLF